MKPFAALVVALALVGAACRQREAVAAGRFPLKGVVRQVDAARAEVTVEHEAVEGFMPAMTMSFPAHDDPPVIALLRPGDRIEATLVVEKDRFWIERILTKGFVPTAAPAVAEKPENGPITPRLNRGVSVGDAVPDFELIDQTGHAVRLSRYLGEPVAVTFLYTRCPVAAACPLTTAKFSQLQALLAQERFGRLLAITVDPVFDTSTALADYAKKAGADSSRWKFLTGSPEAVARAAESFGVVYKPQAGQIVHTQVVAVVDSRGRLATIYYTPDWKPEHLLRDMEAANKT